MKIYTASSWRNKRYPEIVEIIKSLGHEVFDFRNPEDNNHGFHWNEIDSNWRNWTKQQFKQTLNHPIAKNGFKADKAGMEWADAFVLIMPCGRSAHLELGWAVGKNKITYILLSNSEPELMYNLVDVICVNIEELVQELS